MNREIMPHRWAADIATGRTVLENVPAGLRTAVEYQLGLLIGTQRARRLDVREGLASQGSRMTDFEQLSDATKRGVRLGLRREFLYRRYQARRSVRNQMGHKGNRV